MASAAEQMAANLSWSTFGKAKDLQSRVLFALGLLIAAAAFTLFFVRDIRALPNLVLFVFPILLVASLFYADWRWLPAQMPPGKK